MAHHEAVVPGDIGLCRAQSRIAAGLTALPAALEVDQHAGHLAGRDHRRPAAGWRGRGWHEPTGLNAGSQDRILLRVARGRWAAPGDALLGVRRKGVHADFLAGSQR
jgi:hypothetical protein